MALFVVHDSGRCAMQVSIVCATSKEEAAQRVPMSWELHHTRTVKELNDAPAHGDIMFEAYHVE
jgi:hypothetical protein